MVLSWVHLTRPRSLRDARCASRQIQRRKPGSLLGVRSPSRFDSFNVLYVMLGWDFVISEFKFENVKGFGTLMWCFIIVVDLLLLMMLQWSI